MEAAGSRISHDDQVEGLRAELQSRIATLTSLVEPDSTCGLCGAPAVTFVPFAVKDPDAPGEIVPVDVFMCVPCHARHCPRVVVEFDEETHRDLILSSAIDLEAYPRPVARLEAA